MAVTRQFSPQLRQTIEAFASSMQFASMPPAASDGGYSFVFEHSGMLSLSPSGDGRFVVVALGRKPVSNDESYTRRFFLQASLESLTGEALHAGMTAEGMCCYATRIPAEAFDLPTLESNLNLLIAAHEAAI